MKRRGKFGRRLLAACLAAAAAATAAAQQPEAPERPREPAVDRPAAPVAPQPAEGEPVPAAPGRAPVTYWDEYQRALDQAEAEAETNGQDAPAPEGPPAPTGESAEDESPGALFADEDAGEQPTFAENLLNVVFWLCILLAAFLIATYLLRTIGRKARLIPAGDLAEIIGRVYLAPRYSLHFVRTGGRVLVVGVTPAAMNLIAEFDEDAFAHEERVPNVAPANGEKNEDGAKSREKAVRFLEELKQHQKKLADGGPPQKNPPAEDEEIVSLRGDIARLQQLLRDSANDPPR